MREDHKARGEGRGDCLQLRLRAGPGRQRGQARRAALVPGARVERRAALKAIYFIVKIMN
jgi:hypothetical protein